MSNTTLLVCLAVGCQISGCQSSMNPDSLTPSVPPITCESFGGAWCTNQPDENLTTVSLGNARLIQVAETDLMPSFFIVEEDDCWGEYDEDLTAEWGTAPVTLDGRDYPLSVLINGRCRLRFGVDPLRDNPTKLLSAWEQFPLGLSACNATGCRFTYEVSSPSDQPFMLRLIELGNEDQADGERDRR